MNDPFDRAPPIPDAEQLIAQMRASDDSAASNGAREILYRRTFATDAGRAVLADFLSNMGLGAIRPPDMTADERIYADGQQAAALTLMNAAGFDKPSAILMLLTEKLEGQNYDRSDDGTGGRHDGGDDGHLDDDDIPG